MVRPFIEDPGANKMLHDLTPWGELGKGDDVAKVTLRTRLLLDRR